MGGNSSGQARHFVESSAQIEKRQIGGKGAHSALILGRATI